MKWEDSPRRFCRSNGSTSGQSCLRMVVAESEYMAVLTFNINHAAETPTFAKTLYLPKRPVYGIFYVFLISIVTIGVFTQCLNLLLDRAWFGFNPRLTRIRQAQQLLLMSCYGPMCFVPCGTFLLDLLYLALPPPEGARPAARCAPRAWGIYLSIYLSICYTYI